MVIATSMAARVTFGERFASRAQGAASLQTNAEIWTGLPLVIGAFVALPPVCLACLGGDVGRREVPVLGRVSLGSHGGRQQSQAVGH